MSEVPLHRKAMIQETLYGFPRLELMRVRFKDCTLEEFDFAEVELEQRTDKDYQPTALENLKRLRAEKVHSLALMEAARQHLEGITESKRAYRLSKISVWVAVLALVIAIVALL